MACQPVNKCTGRVDAGVGPPVDQGTRGSWRRGIDGGDDAARPQSLDAVTQLGKGGVLGIGNAVDCHVAFSPAAEPALLEGPACSAARRSIEICKDLNCMWLP